MKRRLTRFKEGSVNIFRAHVRRSMSFLNIFGKQNYFLKYYFFLPNLDFIFMSLPNITATNRMVVICNPYKHGLR